MTVESVFLHVMISLGMLLFAATTIITPIWLKLSYKNKSLEPAGSA
jgi:hypothetical protein